MQNSIIHDYNGTFYVIIIFFKMLQLLIRIRIKVSIYGLLIN